MRGDKQSYSKECVENREWLSLPSATADDALPLDFYRGGFIDLAQFVIPWPHTDHGSYGGTGKHYFDPRTGEPYDEDEMTFMPVEGPRGTGYIRTNDPPHNQFIEVRFTPLYFQGHNSFACNDILGICLCGAADLSTRLDLPLPPETLAALSTGDFRLRRVDVTAMIDLSTRETVRNMLKQGEHTRHARLRSAPRLYPNTVLFRGTDYSFKLYDKYEEQKDPKKWGHGCPSDVREQVHQWTETMIRAEMTIREKKLIDLGGLNLARNWTLDTPTRLVREQLGHLRLNWDCDLPPEIVDALPPNEYQYYYAIKGGADPKKCWKNRETRKKYEDLRSGLYENQRPNISILDLKSMEFAPIPEWAIGTEAYFQPSCSEIANYASHQPYVGLIDSFPLP